MVRCRRRNLFVSLGVLLTLAVTIVLAHEGHVPLPSRGATVDVAKGHVALSKEARDVLDVETVEIDTAAPPETILTYASLVAPWKAHAFAVSRLSGRIVSLPCKPGDRVEAGQLLAEVSSPELERLRLEIQNGITEARLLETIYQGMQRASGSIPESTLLANKVQLQQARNTLELAKAKWLALGLSPLLLKTMESGSATTTTPTLPIRSPVRGVVIHTDLTIGKVVEAGEHLFEVIDLSTVWARLGVLEKDVARIRPGLAVEMKLTAYPHESFRGTIAVVGEYLDPKTHLIDAWVEFRNPEANVREPRLLPGSYGQARIELPASQGTFTVPATALINDGVDRFVLVEEANANNVSEFRRKSVIVERETPDVVVLRSSELYPGDRVATRGSHELGAFFAPGTLRLTPESARTIGLKVEPMKRQPIDSIVTVPGVIDLPPSRRSTSTSRLAGTVQSVLVDRGQVVKPGDVLAEVFSLDLLNLQLDYLRERLAISLAEDQLRRVKSAKDVLPRRQLLQAEADYVTAVNRGESLRRQLLLVGLDERQLDELTKRRRVAATLPVRASIAGTIVAFDRVIGQAVRADESLFEIHDLVRPWIQGFVTQQELTRVRLGQRARIRIVGVPDVVLEGKIVRSGRTFGETHRTLSVWVELDRDPPMPLRHNQMARLSLAIESYPPTLAVPQSALHREGTQSFVFVRKEDVFERRLVSLGREDDRFAEVLAGLTEGESIAVTAAGALHSAWASIR